MKVNTKICYGIKCLMELDKSLNEFVGAETIAHKKNVPLAFAHKILQSLARAGLLLSQKGVGYKLVRPLSHVSLLEVIDALESTPVKNPDANELTQIIQQRFNQHLQQISLVEIIS